MYLFGASGHGKVIKEIVESQGKKIIAFVDDNISMESIDGIPVIHKSKDCSPIIVSIGNNRIRRKIVEQLQTTNPRIHFSIAIHPSAVVSSSAKIGKGTVIMAGVVINANAVIGEHCIINTGASVDHDCVIENFCHIAPGVHVSGSTQVGEGSWVGVGSCVIQGIHIGKNCFIGAGSVVVKDLPDGAKAYGNPCRIVCINNDSNMKCAKEQKPKRSIGGGSLTLCYSGSYVAHLKSVA